MRTLTIVALLATRALAEPIAELATVAEHAGADREHCDRIAADYERAGALLVTAGPSRDVATADRVLAAAAKLFAAGAACRAKAPVEPLARLVIQAVEEPKGGLVAADKRRDKVEVRPLSERAKRLAAAYDLASGAITDADLRAGLAFKKASLLASFDRFDEALPIYLDVIDHHPRAEAAEYAATLALDAYNRLGRYDDLVALVERLRGDPKFLAGRAELEASLAKLHQQAQRKAADRIVQDAEATKDPAKFRACGERFAALADEDPKAPSGDELLYNAALCFTHGMAAAEAQRMAATLASRYPRSPLVARLRAKLHP